jgi:hypothetical protein
MRWIWITLGAAILLSSCSAQLQPFTERIYDETYWTTEELQQVQFFLSRDIVLSQRVEGSRSTVDRGEIIIENGAKVRQVVIPSGTPGQFIFSPDKKRFAISFESNPDHYLMFGPNPKLDDRYTLLASSWNRDKGIVSYAGEKWLADRSSAASYLMVDIKRLGKYERERKVLRGRRIN